MENTKSLRYLGEEKISKLIFKFSIPCILSLLISSLYNIVDQIFIGNSELSTLGNAATGVVFPIFIIAQAFAWCFGDGCAAYLNICQGRNETDKAHKSIGTGITLTLISSLVLMAIFYPLRNQVLTLFGASENSMGYAIDYFNIILAFFPFYMLSNMINSVIRADGRPSGSMFSMSAGAIINIILDPIFIFVLHLGMKGAAWATAIGQVASFVISIVYLCKSKTFKLKLKSFVPDFKEFRHALKLGVSTFITQATIVVIALVSNMMLKKYGRLSVFGEDIPLAVISIETKVFTLIINLVVGIILGCQPVIGYNLGAKKYDRVKKLYKDILIVTAIIGVVATILVEAMPKEIAGIFGTPQNIPNPDDYWVFAEKTFRIFLSLVLFINIIKMSSIFFQAVGKPIPSILCSMVRDIILFIPLVIILPKYLRIEGVLYAGPIADIAAIILTIVLTVLYFKRLNKAAASEENNSSIIPSKEGVIITIAREHGSGGKQIGKLVAESLGIPFYYKEMTAIAAKECGLDKEFISEINTNSPNILHSLYLSTNVIQEAISAQDRIIKKIADNGSCVIVGRSADYVLRNYSNVVKIFIYAPEEYKINRVMEIYGDSYEEAKKNVRHSSKARAAYYKNISGLNWGEAKNYDLMIDSSVGIDECAKVICEFVKHREEVVSQKTELADA